ncbi:hypothetical protein FOCC_FOCC001645, partial [Frankliniella occidentalis]
MAYRRPNRWAGHPRTPPRPRRRTAPRGCRGTWCRPRPGRRARSGPRPAAQPPALLRGRPPPGGRGGAGPGPARGGPRSERPRPRPGPPPAATLPPRPCRRPRGRPPGRRARRVQGGGSISAHPRPWHGPQRPPDPIGRRAQPPGSAPPRPRPPRPHRRVLPDV